MDEKYICYNGEGALKSGNHTKKQYLRVMNKTYKKMCATYKKSLKCKSCKKSRKMINNEVKKQIRANLKNRTYKMSVGTESKLVKQMNKCKRCKNKNTKKCTFKNYLLFSGAEIGKCENNID